MNKNKGFTFVELLAVLVVVAILLIVVIPPIIHVFKSTQVKVDESVQRVIEDGTRDLLANENASYNFKDTNKYCIKISELIEKGYVNKEITDNIDSDVYSVITFKNNEPIIELHTSCVKEVNNIYFTLKGDKEMEVTVGSTFADPGVEAYDDKGTDISDKVNTFIMDQKLIEQKKINTSMTGSYIIEYQLVHNNMHIVIERTVRVISTDGPVITHPGNLTIDVDTTSLDVMEGVSAVDKNGNNLEVVAKSNLALGIPGEYTITYTAIDGSGNETSINRSVYIKNVTNNLYVRTEFDGLWQDSIDIDWDTQYVEIQFDSQPITEDLFMGHEFFIIMLGTSTHKYVDEISAKEDGSTYEIYKHYVSSSLIGTPSTVDILRLSKNNGYELINDGLVVGTDSDDLGITSSSKLVVGNQIGEGTGHSRYGELPLIKIEIKNI